MKRRAVVEVLGVLVLLAGCEGIPEYKPRLTLDDYHRALIAICTDASDNATEAAKDPTIGLLASLRWNRSCERELTALQNKRR